MATIRSRKYHNVIEDLVCEEVRRQLTLMSPRLTQYIKRVEVETYALNRLPAFYACSKEGWLHQKRRVSDELSEEVKTAVRQAIAAVQRDLLRSSTPLIRDEEEHKEEHKTATTTANHPVAELSNSKHESEADKYHYLRKSNYYHPS